MQSQVRSIASCDVMLLNVDYSFVHTVSGTTVIVIVGRRAAFCSHEDMLSTIIDPTIICQVQGGYCCAQCY